jgi:hypothetical protein
MLKHRLRGALVGLAATAVIAGGTVSSAAAETDSTAVTVNPGTLAFGLAPDVPALSDVTLNGQAQTVSAQMSNWSVTDGTGAGSGWHVTVQGDGGAGQSAVFKEYCTDGNATNGCDTAVGGGPGPGYVTSSPKALSADSLSLVSTGAGFTAQNGTTGGAPTHSCDSSCNLDVATPVSIASAVANAGMGTFRADTYDASSVSLAIPTTTKAIGSGNKVYRVDLTWTLSSGPGA